MSKDWKSYLDVHIYLTPADENRVRYLMNKVPLDQSDGDARTAKNIAISNAVKEFVFCWGCRSTGTIYVGNPDNYREFDYARYDPKTDPFYTQNNTPNFKCALIIEHHIHLALFFSLNAYDGTVEQLILAAIRTHSYLMKLQDRGGGKPCFWMTNGPHGVVVLEGICLIQIPPPPDDQE